MVDHNNIQTVRISIPEAHEIPTVEAELSIPETQQIPTVEAELSIPEAQQISTVETPLSIPGSQQIPTVEAEQQKANTAANLAYIICTVFSIGTLLCFVFLFAVFLGSWRVTEKPDGSKLFETDVSQGFEMFKNFSVVISSPLGFVLGFYFRQTKGE